MGETVEDSADVGGPVLVRGRGSLGRLPVLLDRLEVRRPILVVGPGVSATAERTRRVLGGRSVGSFTDAVAHVPAWQANLAVASAREVHADSVIAIGGGSAAGYAKIVAHALRLPWIAVPTTLSGAELTSRYLVTTERGKESGRSEWAAARFVVRDPDLLVEVPTSVLGSSGMGTVGACLDILARSTAAGDVAAEALGVLWNLLPRLVGEPADARVREQVLAGAALAGAALEIAGPGPAQVIAEELGAAHRVDHGHLMACLAPHLDVGFEFAEPGQAADAIRRFARSLGLPVELGAVCPPIDADAMAAHLAARPDLAGFDAAALGQLLDAALR